MEIGDGVLDVVCFALTSAEGDLEFQNDPTGIVKTSLLVSVVLSVALMVIEMCLAKARKFRLNWLPTLYCLHLIFEDIFQVFIYAAVAASQAQSDMGSHLAAAAGAIQALAFSCLKVRDVLWP